MQIKQHINLKYFTLNKFKLIDCPIKIVIFFIYLVKQKINKNRNGIIN